MVIADPTKPNPPHRLNELTVSADDGCLIAASGMLSEIGRRNEAMTLPDNKSDGTSYREINPAVGSFPTLECIIIFTCVGSRTATLASYASLISMEYRGTEIRWSRL
jgi:hypothetical protein